MIESLDDINDKWSVWKELFLEVVNLHAPLKKKRCRLKPSLPWMNFLILYHIRQRDSFRRASLATSKSQEEHLRLQSLYTRVRSIVRRELAVAKSEFFFEESLVLVKNINHENFGDLSTKSLDGKQLESLLKLLQLKLQMSLDVLMG